MIHGCFNQIDCNSPQLIGKDNQDRSCQILSFNQGAAKVTCCVISVTVENNTNECTFCFVVERRRRFNINDRIKELGGLLPKSYDQ